MNVLLAILAGIVIGAVGTITMLVRKYMKKPY